MPGVGAPCRGPSPGLAPPRKMRKFNLACTSQVSERVSSPQRTDHHLLPNKVLQAQSRSSQIPKASQVIVPGDLVAIPEEGRPIPMTSVAKLLQEVNLLEPGALFMHMHRWAGNYGKVFLLDIVFRKLLIVSDAAMAKHILLSNAENYNKGILTELLDFVMGNGLITANGDIAVTRRREIAPAFHMKYVQNMLHLFGRVVERASVVLDRHCETGESANIEKMFGQMSLDILGVAVFEHDFNAFTMEDKFMQAVGKLLREAELRIMSPFPFWRIEWLSNLIPQQRRVKEHLRVVNETLDVLIAKCEALVAQEDGQQGDPGTSILRFLLQSGNRVSKQQLRDDLMTLLIAGHESTASVLTWTMYELLKNPAVMQKLQAEVDAVLGDRIPTMEDMERLPYAHQVFFEGLRMYPQPPVLIRRALAEDTLPGACRIPAGSDVFILGYTIHRSEEYWEDGHVFNPDRFPAATRPPNHLLTSYKFLPFGGGPRKCVGEMFAMHEGVTILSMLVRRYNFELDPDVPLEMTSGATIHTVHGMMLKVSRRHAPPTAPRPNQDLALTLPLLPEQPLLGDQPRKSACPFAHL